MLPCDGLADEKRKRVMSFMNQKQGPPPISERKGGPLVNVENFINILWCMVCRCMSPWYSDSHSIDTDRHIKMFLTQLSRLDSEIKGDKSEKPVWITSWTYLCLLNVKRNMQQHGSLRNYYGGKPLGEGIVRKVKPLMSRFTPSWETVTAAK